MRILIEIEDTKPKPPVVSTAGLLAATAPSEAADGGAGPSVGAGSPASDAESVDTGGPPQWLLNAVAREMAASGSSGTGARDEADGGAGPQ